VSPGKAIPLCKSFALTRHINCRPELFPNRSNMDGITGEYFKTCLWAFCSLSLISRWHHWGKAIQCTPANTNDHFDDYHSQEHDILPLLWPVNIIQHYSACPSEDPPKNDEPEMTELPPASTVLPDHCGNPNLRVTCNIHIHVSLYWGGVFFQSWSLLPSTLAINLIKGLLFQLFAHISPSLFYALDQDGL
jgi:hypothetical protein